MKTTHINAQFSLIEEAMFRRPAHREILAASRKQLRAILHAARLQRAMLAAAEARGDTLMRTFYPERLDDLAQDIATKRAHQHRLMRLIKEQG